MLLKIAEAGSSIKNASKRSISFAGLISGAFGFFSDVLRPIAPFAFYLCILSLVGLILGIFFIKVIKKDLLPLILFFAFSFIITGLLVLVNNDEESAERGVLAHSFPAIASLQESIGVIQKDVAEIKVNTIRIDETTKRIEDKTDKVIEGIEQISKQGGVIATPSTPEEFYHNARIQELSGDYSAARRSYLEYFKSDLNKLDPHLRFIKFLKVQEGSIGARETYRAVTENQANSIIPQYVNILLLNREERIVKLKVFAKENPTFAPVYYHLAENYSYAMAGLQTMSERRLEMGYIEKFEESDKKGELLKYFVDQDIIATWREQTAQRKKMTETFMSKSALETPVKVMMWTYMPKSNNSNSNRWEGTMTTTDLVDEFFWKMKGSAGEPESTGFLNFKNEMTGKNYPVQTIKLAGDQPEGTVLVSYRDVKGALNGPYELEFDPVELNFKANISALDQMQKTSGLIFFNVDEKTLLYFSRIFVYRGIIETITYGLDKEVPDTEHEFPSYDLPGQDYNLELPYDVQIIEIPKTTKFATLQLTYKNGEKSEIFKYEVKSWN